MKPRPANNPQSPPPRADVTLLLEGTYPYVLGGVSAWVDQVIRGLPDVKFSLFYIGAKPDPSLKAHYELPSNVVCLQEVYLHEQLSRRELRRVRTHPKVRLEVYDAMANFYLAQSETERLAQLWPMLERLDQAGPFLRFGNLLHDRATWDILTKACERYAPGESFIDFFWTVRFLHLPLWNLWRARSLVPPARVYHAVSTGYAGFIGALTARTRSAPFLLTEHGIYTKERIAEISQAEWIFESDDHLINFSEGLGKLKQLWIDLFMFFGRMAYEQAARIITLYEGNASTQVEFGADPAKIEIVPNGIEPSRFDDIYRQQMLRWQTDPGRKYVGFIGRVVPIKDVKTLLRAARIVCERMPEVEFLIAGPFAEDPLYYEDCRKIVSMLNLEDKVHFLGMQKIMEVLPRMDLLVLTSISEGLPLVVLEGMASGKPNVATSVGACRELIFGRTVADRALGRAGRLTKVMSPAETAHSLISILQSPETVVRMGQAGRARAEQFYSMKIMLESYRDAYRELAGGRARPAARRRPKGVEAVPVTLTPA